SERPLYDITATLLRLTNPSNIIDVTVPSNALSGHYHISCTVNRFTKLIKDKSGSHLEIQYRNFKTFNEELFFLHEIRDSNEAINMWYYLIINILDKHAPVVTKRIKNKYQPEWYTNEICKSAHQRDYYHKKKDMDNYKKYRNLTNKLIRSSKSNYFMEAINHDKNCKSIWRHLKDLNSTTGHDIDMITYEDKNLTDKIDIVNGLLNDHFSSVGETLIPHPHSNFESEKINNYVKSKINDNRLFSLYTVTNADVFKYLTNLDINKSTGTDEVGPRISKVSKSINEILSLVS
ncbi:Hypothetical predicted protein, partial [Mytilus galloprovincialis]